nr:reverse transcriptase domain-containing protein [Tanacetum cinerariifolium]
MLRACLHHGFTKLAQIDTFYNGLNDNDQDSLNVTAGGNLLSTTSKDNASKSDDRIDKLADQISTLVDIFANKIVTPAPVKANQSLTSGTLLSNTIPNPKGYMKAITTRSGVAYDGHSIPTPKKVVEQETKEITDKKKTNFQGSIAHIQPPVTPILESDVLKTLPKPNIPYPSRLNDQKLREKATNQMEKFFQIFQDFHFDISFTDALILMPKFASTIKSLLTNKDKLFELAKIPLNENCSVMLLKKLPENLGDPGKFLIPCDFLEIDEDYKCVVQSQRWVNPKIHKVIKKEVIKLLDADMIYPISDSPWVSPIHCVPKKGRITVVENENNELIPTRLVTRWRVCIDYRKLNDAARKDYFSLHFMDQMLERLTGNDFLGFLDGFYGYIEIQINPPDQEKTNFTCSYGTFSYRIMPFGLCNASGTFQRCMMAIFHDMIEKTMEVFMDDFSVFGDSFSSCLFHLDTMLQRKFISGLGIVPTINELIRMFCDNSAALYFANEPRVQRGARHYHRRYHYVRESVALTK